MKPEEAYSQFYVWGDSGWSKSETPNSESLVLAIQAIEKQIPLKPQLESDGYSDGELVYDTWICPKCGEDYEIDFHDYKYCPECGQRIDRGDIE